MPTKAVYSALAATPTRVRTDKKGMKKGRFCFVIQPSFAIFAAGWGLPVRIDIRKAFCFILYKEIANFETRGIKQSRTLMLAYIYPGKGFAM